MRRLSAWRTSASAKTLYTKEHLVVSSARLPGGGLTGVIGVVWHPLLIIIFDVNHANAITLAKPPPEIHVSASFGTKRPPAAHARFATCGTAPAGTGRLRILVPVHYASLDSRCSPLTRYRPFERLGSARTAIVYPNRRAHAALAELN